MKKQRETTHIVEPMVSLFKHRGWTCHNIHGNNYQDGLPDYFIHHPDYEDKWIEFKVFYDNYKVHLTKAQKRVFPSFCANNVSFYAIAGFDLRGRHSYKKRLDNYLKLFQKPNGYKLLDKRLWRSL